MAIGTTESAEDFLIEKEPAHDDLSKLRKLPSS